MYELGCILSGSKGMSMGLLFEGAGPREGMAVISVGGLLCTVVWHGPETFAVVLLLVLFEGGFKFKPVISLRIFSMASNLLCSVGGLPLMVSSRFLIALVMQSAVVMVGVGRVW